MKYAYGVTSALLLGGAALSLVSGIPLGAQVAQNEAGQMQTLVPRNGAPVSFADLTQQLQPAVVNIAVRQTITVKSDNPFAAMQPGGGSQTKLAQAVGSGFIISADGYIVTNNHVISLDREGQADEVTVKLADGKQYTARIIGRDAESDVAVLKIDAPTPLPFVKFGDSGKARAGDWIIAIGNPFGLGGTVTSGIISSVNRNTGTGAYDHYIQTDASINSGNSGGPMFDMAGNVIGINNWIVSSGGGGGAGGNIGIGFAIPSDTAKPIVEKLKSGAAIERGYLGIQIQPISDEIADSLGLPHDRGELVRLIQPGQPAEKAGVKVGDIVLKVNDETVTPSRTLSGIVSDIVPGKRIPIEVLRGGKSLKLYATVAKRPSQQELAKSLSPATKTDQLANPAVQGEGLAESALGLKVLTMVPEIAEQLGVPLSQRGVVIAAVDSASDAANNGLQRGDIVVSANIVELGSVTDLEKSIRSAKALGRPTMTLQVLRPGQPGLVFIALRIR